MAYVQSWPCRCACTPVEQEAVPSPPPSPPVYDPQPEEPGVNAASEASSQTEVMVNNTPQQLTQIIQPSQALPLGTLFPELNKPLTSTSSPITARPTAKQMYSFTAWEMRLYLDTHPSDTVALALFQQMAAAAGQPNYASTFATAFAGGRWSWLDDPWPWEFGASTAEV